MFERLWCKVFHKLDNYFPVNPHEKKEVRWVEYEKESHYDTKFCPLCQKCRFVRRRSQ